MKEVTIKTMRPEVLEEVLDRLGWKQVAEGVWEFAPEPPEPPEIERSPSDRDTNHAQEARS